MNSLKRFMRNFIYTFKDRNSSVDLKVYFFYNVVTPILQVIFYSLVAKHAYSGQDITPYIIGNALVLCANCAFFGVGIVLISERGAGTLKNIVASPSDNLSVFFGKSSYYIAEGFLTVILGVVAGALIFKINIELSLIPVLIVIIIVAIFSACSMGILIGSIGLVTRDINMLLNVSTMSLMALSGVNFPLDRLPVGLQFISNLLPLTNSLKAARLLVVNATTNGVAILIVKELIIGIAYCLIGYVVFSIMDRISRIKATVDIY